jgi:hypothetical protein
MVMIASEIPAAMRPYSMAVARGIRQKTSSDFLHEAASHKDRRGAAREQFVVLPLSTGKREV